MSITRARNQAKRSEQYIQNASYDEDFDVLAFELLEFDGAQLIRKPSDTQNMKIVESGGYTYICKSPVGTAEATEAWQICRIDSDGNKMYANGASTYTNAASDPTSLSYSYS